MSSILNMGIVLRKAALGVLLGKSTQDVAEYLDKTVKRMQPGKEH